MPGDEKAGKWVAPGTKSSNDVIYETPTGKIVIVEARPSNSLYSVPKIKTKTTNTKNLGNERELTIDCFEIAISPIRAKPDAAINPTPKTTNMYRTANDILPTRVTRALTNDIVGNLDSCDLN